MKTIFQFKDGYRGNVPAQVAGERIAAIEAANGGYLRPSDVVKDSRPDEAPLHPCFEWDDAVAAEQHREGQARMLIRSVYRIEEDADGKDVPVLHHIHVTLPEEGPCYVTTTRAMSDDELREQVLADALSAIRSWQNRYRHIQKLVPIFTAIDDVLNAAERKGSKRQLAAAN